MKNTVRQKAVVLITIITFTINILANAAVFARYFSQHDLPFTGLPDPTIPSWICTASRSSWSNLVACWPRF
jgi:hypothetical protein